MITIIKSHLKPYNRLRIISIRLEYLKPHYIVQIIFIRIITWSYICL